MASPLLERKIKISATTITPQIIPGLFANLPASKYIGCIGNSSYAQPFGLIGGSEKVNVNSNSGRDVSVLSAWLPTAFSRNGYTYLLLLAFLESQLLTGTT